MAKRIFDLVIAIFLGIVLLIPMLIIAFLIILTTHEKPLYWSNRVGQHNKIFKMCKFRTMISDTPPVATHLLDNADKYLTPLGSFLRKTSLDELPQIFNVIMGNMSLVGPRPALFNQDDLVDLRTKKNVQSLLPGVTGWAQVNGRDELPIPVKVGYDEYYLKNKSFFMDVKIIIMTLYKVINREGVKH